MAQRKGQGYDPAMSLLRALIACLLALSLAWASADQALAHAGLSGGTMVTLCDSSGQTATIALDADGKPAQPHSCTHCLAAQALAVLPPLPATPAARAAMPLALAPARPFLLPAPRPPQPAQPRAPPVPV